MNRVDPNGQTKEYVREENATTVVFCGSSVDISGAGAKALDLQVVIEKSGTYLVSGEAQGASIVVDVPGGKVNLVLAGLKLCSDKGPCILIADGDARMVLEQGSTNVVRDGSGWRLARSKGEPDATIYSKSDLAIGGTGSLTVHATTNHAIKSTRGIVVESGTFTIDANHDGLHGRDFVKVLDGDFIIDATGDGIDSPNDKDKNLGFVSIDHGSFKIKAGDQGVEACRLIRIAHAEMFIESKSEGMCCDHDIEIAGGSIVISSQAKHVKCKGSCMIAEGVIDKR